MRSPARLLPIVCAAAGLVLTLGMVVVLRVAHTKQYSSKQVPPDAAANDVLQRWDQLEQGFRERARRAVLPTLPHDPLWPVYVPRPGGAPAPPAPAARVATPVAAARTPPAEAPAPEPPRLVALLLDGQARAVLQHEGRSRTVQSGDR